MTNTQFLALLTVLVGIKDEINSVVHILAHGQIVSTARYCDHQKIAERVLFQCAETEKEK